MIKRFYFGAISPVTLMVALCSPLLLELSRFLAEQVKIQEHLRWDFKKGIGELDHFGGPSLVVPVLRANGSLPRQSEIKVPPALLNMTVDNETRRAYSAFGDVNWHANTIEMTASFDRQIAQAALP